MIKNISAFALLFIIIVEGYIVYFPTKEESINVMSIVEEEKEKGLKEVLETLESYPKLSVDNILKDGDGYIIKASLKEEDKKFKEEIKKLGKLNISTYSLECKEGVTIGKFTLNVK